MQYNSQQRQGDDAERQRRLWRYERARLTTLISKG